MHPLSAPVLSDTLLASDSDTWNFRIKEDDWSMEPRTGGSYPSGDLKCEVASCRIPSASILYAACWYLRPDSSGRNLYGGTKRRSS